MHALVFVWFRCDLTGTISNSSFLVNSMAPGRPGCHLKTAIFNLVLSICIVTSSNDNPLRWISWDLTDDKSTLVQVMAWCCQAASHYLSLCWPRSLSPYGVTRPKWVKSVVCNFMLYLHIIGTNKAWCASYECSLYCWKNISPFLTVLWLPRKYLSFSWYKTERITPPDQNQVPITMTCQVPITMTCQVPITMTCQVPITVTCQVPITMTCQVPITMTCQVPITVTCQVPITMTCQVPITVTCQVQITVTCQVPITMTCQVPITVTCQVPITMTCQVPITMTCQVPITVTCQVPITMTCQVPITMTCQVPIIMTCQVPITMTCQVPITVTCQVPITMTCQVPITVTCQNTCEFFEHGRPQSAPISNLKLWKRKIHVEI